MPNNGGARQTNIVVSYASLLEVNSTEFAFE